MLVWFMGEKPAEDPSHCLQGLGFTCQEGCPQALPHSLQEKQDPRVGMCPTHVFFFNIYLYVLGCAGSLLRHVGSSSLPKDRTQVPCFGSKKSYPLDHQGSPAPRISDTHYFPLPEAEVQT